MCDEIGAIYFELELNLCWAARDSNWKFNSQVSIKQFTMHKMIKYDAIDQDVSDCGSFVILHSYEDVTSPCSYKLIKGAISKPNGCVWQNWCNSNNSEGRRNFYPPNNFIDNIRYKKYYKKNVAPLMYPFEGNELAGSHNNGASYYFVETI